MLLKIKSSESHWGIAWWCNLQQLPICLLLPIAVFPRAFHHVSTKTGTQLGYICLVIGLQKQCHLKRYVITTQLNATELSLKTRRRHIQLCMMWRTKNHQYVLTFPSLSITSISSTSTLLKADVSSSLFCSYTQPQTMSDDRPVKF